MTQQDANSLHSCIIYFCEYLQLMLWLSWTSEFVTQTWTLYSKLEPPVQNVPTFFINLLKKIHRQDQIKVYKTKSRGSSISLPGSEKRPPDLSQTWTGTWTAAGPSPYEAWTSFCPGYRFPPRSQHPVNWLWRSLSGSPETLELLRFGQSTRTRAGVLT